MGAYKHDVVVVIKMGAYIHGVLILCGCLLSRFYGIILAAVVVYTSVAVVCTDTKRRDKGKTIRHSAKHHYPSSSRHLCVVILSVHSVTCTVWLHQGFSSH